MEPSVDPRSRIVAAAADLLSAGGREALTTRAVSAAAGVQAPTIYRLFGDKNGLLDAVAEHGFTVYVQGKETGEFGPDPVADLRAGWDLHIGFGLANPTIFSIMYANASAGIASPAVAAGEAILRERIHRIAVAGRLRVSEERATNLMAAAGRGVVLTLLSMPEGERDPGLSETAREAVIAAITTESPVLETPGPAAAAVALRAVLGDATTLTEGERHLLDEWLAKLVS